MIRLFIITLLIASIGCKQQQKKSPEFSCEQISQVITKMTDIMVHDVTNPPLASRFFSYACLAGYQVVAENNKEFKSMHGILNDYPDMQKSDSVKGYSYQLTALLAMMETAAKMQPSGSLLLQYENQFLDSCLLAGFDED
ncbi:MAG: haloperoxidase, partial [Chitinophagaceae bacterium]